MVPQQYTLAWPHVITLQLTSAETVPTEHKNRPSHPRGVHEPFPLRREETVLAVPRLLPDISQRARFLVCISLPPGSMSNTEAQNPRRKLDVFGSVLACAKPAHVFQKLSYSLCGPNLRYYNVGIPSEPLVKDSHKRLSLREKPQYRVLQLT